MKKFTAKCGLTVEIEAIDKSAGNAHSVRVESPLLPDPVYTTIDLPEEQLYSLWDLMISLMDYAYKIAKEEDNGK